MNEILFRNVIRDNIKKILTEASKKKDYKSSKKTKSKPDLVQKSKPKPKPSKISTDSPLISKKTDTSKYENGTFKADSLGVKLSVKGDSYADINYNQLILYIKKCLEGKGKSVLRVNITMGNNIDTLKEYVLKRYIHSVISKEIRNEIG